MSQFLTKTQVQSLLTEQPQTTILDVRTPQEFAAGHLPQAINLDFYEPTFRDDIKKLNPNATYLVYCLRGSRSGNAAEFMDQSGFKNVYQIQGGLEQYNRE